jgi:hypothetical protein
VGEAWKLSSTPRNKTSNLRAADLAGAQWGVIGCRQLGACGVTRATASRWRAQAKLHVIHPGVYALGHRAVPIEGHLVAALLYAGDGFVLSHQTAAWWWGLIEKPPSVIHLSGTRRVRPSRGLVIHRRRRFDATRHHRFPITTLPQTFLDLAATEPLVTVRRALAEADYRGVLDAGAVAGMAGRVIVELDGRDNHHTWGQIQRDRRKDLALRTAGFIVLRYTWQQLEEERELVIADVLASLGERAA